MRIELAQNHNSHVALGLEINEGQINVVTIEAHGLIHQVMSRQSFLREFSRDLLAEEWEALCKFLKIALSKESNEDYAITTLMKGIDMKLSELKDKSMEELVSMHNEMATAVGAKTVEKFKNLEAARIAVVKVSKAKPPKTKAAKAATGGGAEGRPRSGVGKRAKEILLEGKSNQETLDAIKSEFPDNSTTLSCIAYYRNALVKAGQLQGGRQKKAEKAEAPAKAVKGSKKKKAA